MEIFYSIKCLLFIMLIEMFATYISCDFAYAYKPDDFPLALLNITYIDPVTSMLKVDSDDFGRYGMGRFADLTGVVVHITTNNHTSHLGCDRFDTDKIPKEPYIALIKHGDCRDHVKLMHAIEANASGVVVYSNQLDKKILKLGYKTLPSHYINDYLPIFIINKDNPPPPIHHPKLPIRNFTMLSLQAFKDNFHSFNLTEIEAIEDQLPYVFITGEKGKEIAALVDNGTRVMMRIVCSMSPIRGHTSVLFVSISFVLLMVLLMAWLIFYYVQRFRAIVTKEMLTKRLCSAAQKALDKIPVKTISSEMYNAGEEDFCAVCIEPLKPEEIVRVLPCDHSFHKLCVDPWLLERRNCPMCKLDIVLHFGLTYSGSQESIIELDDVTPRHRRENYIETVHTEPSRRNSSSQTSPYMQDIGTSTTFDLPGPPIEKAWRLPLTEDLPDETLSVAVQSSPSDGMIEKRRRSNPRILPIPSSSDSSDTDSPL